MCDVSFAAVTDAIGEGLLPHSLHLLWHYSFHTRTLESLICSVPCLLFIMLLCIPCITAAGGIPKSRITPPSQSLFPSPFAIDMSVPGRIIMAVQSNQGLGGHSCN